MDEIDLKLLVLDTPPPELDASMYTSTPLSVHDTIFIEASAESLTSEQLDELTAHVSYLTTVSYDPETVLRYPPESVPELVTPAGISLPGDTYHWVDQLNMTIIRADGTSETVSLSSVQLQTPPL